MQQKVRFQIEGMTCQACASRIEKVLNKKDFVESAGVNFASEEAQVTLRKPVTAQRKKRKIHCRNLKQNTISAGGCGFCWPLIFRF